MTPPSLPWGRGGRQRGFLLLAVSITLAVVAALAYMLNFEGGMNLYAQAADTQVDSARYLAEAGYAHARWANDQNNCAAHVGVTGTLAGMGSYSATVTPSLGSPVTIVATGTTPSGATASLTRTGVVVRRTAVTPASLPATADTWVDKVYRDQNYGAGANIRVDGKDGANGLIQFSLASIPAGSAVVSSALKLYQYATLTSNSGGQSTIALRRLTTAWVEGTGGTTGATWRRANAPGMDWLRDGGDFGAPISNIQVYANGWYTWTATKAVEAWMNNAAANYGFALDAGNKIENADFASRFYSDPTKAPVLQVNYLAPC